MIEFYYCQSFNDKISNCNVKEQVCSRLEKIRNIQFKNMETLEYDLNRILDRYSKDIYVYKTNGRQNNTRTIIEIRRIEELDDYIYYVRDFINHGEYELKWRNGIEPKIKDGSWLTQHPISEDEISKSIRQYKENRKTPELPSPPSELTNWMSDFNPNILFSVFETDQWVEFSMSNNPDEQMKDPDKAFLWEIINSIMKGSLPKSVSIIDLISDGNRNLKLAKNTEMDVCIIYEDLNMTDEIGDVVVNKIVLHSGGNLKSQSTHVTQAKEKAKVHPYFSEVKYCNYDLTQVSRHCNKAYPYSAVKDRESWFIIQNNDENSNLSLLPEQIQLLNTLKFPSFINGQAGSGKSTMLYYLFSEICIRKFMDDIKGNLIYLTENSELLENARREIKSLLKANSVYSGYNLTDEHIIQLENFFSTFFDLLIDLYTKNEIGEDLKFGYDERVFKKYVTFSKFKELYLGSQIGNNIKSKYSPELAWYIITTFIKGYDRSKHLTPEEFEQLPRRDKGQISFDTYKIVFEELWKKFYQPLIIEQNYWDRLDLVRYILNSFSKLHTKYNVIFCDEAQDFTRVELQLLIRLSDFTNYDLSYEENVPILFAGDPFQTVNPTGFNLEKLKNLFYKELKEQLNFSLTGSELVKDLKYNYRSSSNIVNLSNLIQFIRYKFLGIYELKEPQEAKLPKGDQFELPKIICLDSRSSSDLKDKLQFDKILVPCEDGEEANYVIKDEWLTDDENIQSAVRSKGSEYSRVVLYKFGQYFIENFNEDLLNEMLDDSLKIEDGKLYELSFYFNKLYVAITRAKKKLIIIDTEKGVNSFWEKIKNNTNIKTSLKKETIWNNNINLHDVFITGDVENLKDPDKKTALANAEEDFRIGKLTRDKDKLLSSAKFYRKAGEKMKSILCEAMSYEYCNEWKKAGKKYLELNRYDEACKCFWYGGEWEEFFSDFPGKDKYKSRIIVASLMSNKDVDLSEFNKYSTSIADELNDKQFKIESNWSANLFQQIQKYFSKTLDSISDNNLILETANSLNNLSNQKDISKLIGDYYYKGGSFREAIEVWDRFEYNDHNKYFESKIKIGISDKSIKIFYLAKLERFDNIVQEFLEERSGIKLTDIDIAKIIIRSLIEKDRFDLLSETPELLYNFSDVFRIISKDKIKLVTYLDELYKQLNIDEIAKNKLLDQNNSKFTSELLLALRNLNLDGLNKILDFTERSKLSKNHNENKRELVQIFRTLTRHFEESTDIIVSVLNILSISGFIHTSFLVKESQYNDKILKPYKNLVLSYIMGEINIDFETNCLSFSQICSCIERTINHYIDIALVYELFLEYDLPEEVSHYIQKRWLMVKYKQIMIRNDSDTGDTFVSGEKSAKMDAVIDSYSKIFKTLKNKINISTFRFNDEPDLPSPLSNDIILNNLKKIIKESNILIENPLTQQIMNDKVFSIKDGEHIKSEFSDALRQPIIPRVNSKNSENNKKSNKKDIKKSKVDVENKIENSDENLSKRVESLEKKIQESDLKLDKILNLLEKLKQ